MSVMIEAKKDKLIHNDKIEVRKSILQGYGVFAKDFIKKGEILEECHLVEVPKIPYPNNKSEAYQHYEFVYPKGPIPTPDTTIHVLSLGFGSIYNSSYFPDDSNATWENGDNIFIFKAIKDIKKDEEILLYYANGDPSVKYINTTGKRTKPKVYVKK